MRGHVFQRGATWSFMCDVGKDPMTGKRRQEMRGGFANKKAAEKALRVRLTALDDGSGPERKGTVGEFLLSEWLPGIRTTVKATTFDGYERMVKAHLAPRIGHVQLRDLSPAQLNAVYAEMADSGRKDGKGGLSSRTVRLAHVTVHRALKDAVRWRKLSRNVADDADPPKEERREMSYWAPAEARRFLEHITAERLYPLFLTALTTGMRRGELAGLTWSDVDLEHGTVVVSRSLVVAAHKLVTSTTKTDRARVIAIDPATVDVLREHRQRQLAERLLMGAGWRDRGLVFAAHNGEPIHPNVISRTFDRLVARSKVPRIRFHDLRHTHATAALAAGVSTKVVSERLGHSSVMITLDVYQHALPAMDRDAAVAIASGMLPRRR